MGKAVILLVKEIYYPILAVVGLPANVMTIVILSRGNCGLSKCITTYMVAMATADLLLVIINVMLYYIFSYHFPLSFLSHTPVCRTILYMAAVTLDSSVWFTVTFTFDRFVAICCQKLKTRLCTKRVAIAIVTTASIVILLRDIPVWLSYEPLHIINKVHWGCQSSVEFYSSPPGTEDTNDAKCLKIVSKASDEISHTVAGSLQLSSDRNTTETVSVFREKDTKTSQKHKKDIVEDQRTNENEELKEISTMNVLSVSSIHLPIVCLTVNLVAIVILSQGKCGLSTCTTRYLVAMATADLLFITTEVIMWRIIYYYFPGSFLLITHACSVINVLRRATTECSVWFTVTFTFDRFVAICCQKLKTKFCTEKTATLVLATTCGLLCVKDIPYYFAQEPGEIINNVPWFCYIKPSYYTEPAWVVYDWFDNVLTPLLPFTFILLLNTLTVRHILVSNRVRQGLRAQSKGENHSDPEMESRRKSVILLFTISGSFILLWLVHVVDFLYYNITGANTRDYSKAEFIFQRVGFMLRNLSCCTNTFIYGATQSKFREQLKQALKYPVTVIIQIIHKHTN
ncbi:uncharacterized protein [Scyliorhinus torazame]|uniref:uncharacterized protein n=1 Tax=Scyliorhinus torazame TaxID=75743 RepID=UPI003B5974C5